MELNRRFTGLILFKKPLQEPTTMRAGAARSVDVVSRVSVCAEEEIYDQSQTFLARRGGRRCFPRMASPRLPLRTKSHLDHQVHCVLARTLACGHSRLDAEQDEIPVPNTTKSKPRSSHCNSIPRSPPQRSSGMPMPPRKITDISAAARDRHRGRVPAGSGGIHKRRVEQTFDPTNGNVNR